MKIQLLFLTLLEESYQLSIISFLRIIFLRCSKVKVATGLRKHTYAYLQLRDDSKARHFFRAGFLTQILLKQYNAR